MAWLTLFAAGLFEVAWSALLKYDGAYKMLSVVVTVIACAASMWLLSLALKEIPLGTAYTVWTGMGMVGAILIGTMVYHEPISLARGVFLGMIIFGVVGLQLSGGH